MKRIILIISTLILLPSYLLYPKSERAPSYALYPIALKDFPKKGIDDALALKSILMEQARDNIFVIANYTKQSFNIKMEIPCIIGSTKIELFAPAIDTRNNKITPVVERAFKDKGCRPNKIKLYLPNSTTLVEPPGTIEFDQPNGSLVITIREYIESPGKYYVKIVKLDEFALTDKETVIRDTRVARNKNQVVNQTNYPKTKEDLRYVPYKKN